MGVLYFMRMHSALPRLQKRLSEIESDLQNQETLRDVKKINHLSQEHNELNQIIHDIQALDSIERNIQENANLLLEEKDSEMIELIEHEIKKLKSDRASISKSIERALTPSDPLDGKDIILEIRAGTGGDEAALFAAELFRMYARFSERQKWKAHIISSNRTGIGGFKEIIIEIQGKNVYRYLKYESGVHRVQRIPETEKSGRVHTSAATVAVLPEAEDIDLHIRPEDIRVDVFRSSGHGGQSVNTTDSAVRITYLPTKMIVTCQDEKSQTKNKDKAMKVLRARLLDIRQKEEQTKRREARKAQIGTGDRSEKIRTYNFPQDRITDHRIKESWHHVSSIMDGDILPMIEILAKYDQQKKEIQ